MNEINELVRENIRKMKPYAAPPVIEVEIKLNQNESPFNLPKNIIEKIKERIDNVEFNRYPDGSCKRLRELIAKKFNVNSNQVVFGCGVDELLYYLTFVLIEKNDKIVRPVPSFGMYDICAEISDAKDTPILLDENFNLPERFIEKSKNAKLVFICRPNSQTCNSWDKKTIEKIIKETSGIVCIDEAYADFAEDDCTEFLKYENVVIMRTFSKVYLAAGVRLGYAITNEKLINYINRIRLPWNLSITSQIIGEIILENEEIFKNKLEIIKKNREELLKEMKKLVKTLPTQTNYISFEVENPKEVFEKLIEKGILIRDISNYPMLEKYLRVNVGTQEENKKFITALKEILEKKPKAIIFDIDGVLVDVSNSYDEAIKKTVEKFTGKRPSDEDIKKIRKKPNSNNDWVVSYAIATNFEGDLSKIDRDTPEFLKMKERFQEFYLGGLINEEEILIELELFKKLKEKGVKIGVVTSRPREEALYVLKRIGSFEEEFIIAQEDCEEEKPSPKPIETLLEKLETQNAVYIGDTINDEIAAKKARVGYENVDKNQNVNDILKRLIK